MGYFDTIYPSMIKFMIIARGFSCYISLDTVWYDDFVEILNLVSRH